MLLCTCTTRHARVCVTLFVGCAMHTLVQVRGNRICKGIISYNRLDGGISAAMHSVLLPGTTPTMFYIHLAPDIQSPLHLQSIIGDRELQWQQNRKPLTQKPPTRMKQKPRPCDHYPLVGTVAQEDGAHTILCFWRMNAIVSRARSIGPPATWWTGLRRLMAAP